MNTNVNTPPRTIPLDRVTTVILSGGSSTSYTMDEILAAVREDIFNKLYPVDSIYITTDNRESCPIQDFIPNSQWEQVAKDMCLQGSSNNHKPKETISPALPNIKGTFWGQTVNSRTYNVWPTVTGAFYPSEDNAEKQPGPNVEHDRNNTDIAFSAARGTSAAAKNIYKDDCTTVQPPAYIVTVWRRKL